MKNSIHFVIAILVIASQFAFTASSEAQNLTFKKVTDSTFSYPGEMTILKTAGNFSVFAAQIDGLGNFQGLGRNIFDANLNKISSSVIPGTENALFDAFAENFGTDIILAYTSDNGGWFDIDVMRLSSPNVIWHKNFGGPQDESLRDICVSGDSAIYIVGNNYSNPSPNHAYIMKINASGDSLWANSIFGSQATAVAALPDGGVAVVVKDTLERLYKFSANGIMNGSPVILAANHFVGPIAYDPEKGSIMVAMIKNSTGKLCFQEVTLGGVAGPVFTTNHKGGLYDLKVSYAGYVGAGWYTGSVYGAFMGEFDRDDLSQIWARKESDPLGKFFFSLAPKDCGWIGAGSKTKEVNESFVYDMVLTRANYPKPSADVTPAGPLTICSGSSSLLTASSGTDYTYQWKRNGAIISGAAFQSYSVNTAGNYKVVVTNKYGCTKASPTVNVTVQNCARIAEEDIVSSFPENITVYPNPSADSFSMKTSEPIFVFNSLGQMVYEDRSETNEKVFGESFVPGAYFVQCAGKTIRILKTE